MEDIIDRLYLLITHLKNPELYSRNQFDKEINYIFKEKKICGIEQRKFLDIIESKKNEFIGKGNLLSYPVVIEDELCDWNLWQSEMKNINLGKVMSGD